MDRSKGWSHEIEAAIQARNPIENLGKLGVVM